MADWKQALAAVNQALGVVSAAASTPGINLIPYVSTVANVTSAIQAGLNAAVDVAPYVEAIAATFSGGLPSLSQLAALDAKIADLKARVDAPLPAKEDGEEE